MRISDLDFEYPQDLVATEPSRPSRVAYVAGDPIELSIPELIDRIPAGDLFVINESQVIPARVFAEGEIEVLFLKSRSPRDWEVLFPARAFKTGATLALPAGLEATLIEKGLPQVLRLSRDLEPEYFTRHGEVALPPYIQEARGERHNRAADRDWYQTAWSREPGSVAAPTASLHFQKQDLERLRARGVDVAALTLHVGAGTFLPIRGEDLDEHTMHAEEVFIPRATLEKIRGTQARGGRIWALGTTVTRSLESWAHGLLEENGGGAFGATRLFIRPGFEYKVVGGLLTNFHQPRSTLLSLVAAFAGLEKMRDVYRWAIDRKFKLFSYGDLSAWIK